MRISDWSSDGCSSELGQPLDDHLHEADLLAGVEILVQELAKGFLGGAAVKAYQRTDEHGQRPVAAKAVLEALAALHHVRLVDEALQLGQVGRRQRLVVLQLGDGHVVLAGARSEERRVGKECVSTCRSRWSAYH